MNVEVESLVQTAQQFLIESKWNDAIKVLTQVEEALPSSSLDIAVCFLREKVGTLLSQAYERVGLLAGALNASKMVHVECMKSRALLLLRSNYPNEAAPILKELAAIDKSWVEQVQAEQRRKTTPSTASLLDLGPAALDLVLLQIERWGLFRARWKVGEGQHITFDRMLKCGSLTVEMLHRSRTDQLTSSFPFGQVEARHLTLKWAKFPAGSEILKIKGLSYLRLERCQNVRLDLTGIEELNIYNCYFAEVTGSLKSLRKLVVYGVGSTDPFMIHLLAKKPKLVELEITSVLFPHLQRQIVTVKSFGIEIPLGNMRQFILNPELWQNVRDLYVRVANVVDLDLWATWMGHLINCRGLTVHGWQCRGLPYIWPPKLAYLKLSGMIKFGKSTDIKSKRLPKGQVSQPNCIHIAGDEVFGLKLKGRVRHLILEDFTRKCHRIIPKDVQNLQVIVIGNKGLTPENKAPIPSENVTSGLVRGQAIDDLFRDAGFWGDRELAHFPPWGLSKHS